MFFVFKRIGKPEGLFLRHFLIPIIKHYTMGCWQRNLLRSIKAFLGFLYDSLIFLCQINQETHWQIRIHCTLMLIKIQNPGKNKRQVILHHHINRTFNRHHLQHRRILIIGSIQCVIQLQQSVSVLLKQKTKESVLDLAVDLIMSFVTPIIPKVSQIVFHMVSSLDFGRILLPFVDFLSSCHIV